MGNFEVPAQKTVRLGKEKKITDFHGGGDTFQTNKELDSYPHDKDRGEISLERAHEIARSAIRNAGQITSEFEAVA